MMVKRYEHSHLSDVTKCRTKEDNIIVEQV